MSAPNFPSSSFDFTMPVKKTTAPTTTTTTASASKDAIFDHDLTKVSWAQYESKEKELEAATALVAKLNYQIEQKDVELEGWGQAGEVATATIDQMEWEVKSKKFDLEAKSKECEAEKEAKKKYSSDLLHQVAKCKVAEGCRISEREARLALEKKVAELEALVKNKDQDITSMQGQLDKVYHERERFHEGRREGEHNATVRLKRKYEPALKDLENDIALRREENEALAISAAEAKTEAENTIIELQKTIALLEAELVDLKTQLSSATDQHSLDRKALLAEKDVLTSQYQEAALSVTTASVNLDHLHEKHNALVTELDDLTTKYDALVIEKEPISDATTMTDFIEPEPSADAAACTPVIERAPGQDAATMTDIIELDPFAEAVVNTPIVEKAPVSNAATMTDTIIAEPEPIADAATNTDLITIEEAPAPPSSLFSLALSRFILALMAVLLLAPTIAFIISSLPTAEGPFGYGGLMGDNFVTRAHATYFYHLAEASGGVHVLM